MYDLVLAALVSAVAGYAIGWARHRPRPKAAQNGAQAAPWECRCGRKFWDDQQAKEHAIDTHNAPSQAGEWRFLYEGAA